MPLRLTICTSKWRAQPTPHQQWFKNALPRLPKIRNERTVIALWFVSRCRSRFKKRQRCRWYLASNRSVLTTSDKRRAAFSSLVTRWQTTTCPSSFQVLLSRQPNSPHREDKSGAASTTVACKYLEVSTTVYLKMCSVCVRRWSIESLTISWNNSWSWTSLSWQPRSTAFKKVKITSNLLHHHVFRRLLYLNSRSKEVNQNQIMQRNLVVLQLNRSNAHRIY